MCITLLSLTIVAICTLLGKLIGQFSVISINLNKFPRFPRSFLKYRHAKSNKISKEGNLQANTRVFQEIIY